jgi:Rieske Fe-S protein
MPVPSAPLCRRRLLLLGATAAGSAACGEVVPAPADAALDAAPDAPADAAADAPRDVARDTGPNVPRGYVRLGPVADFRLDQWTGFTSPEVIVGRDAAGLFAYSASCTHWGCVIPAPEGPGANSVCPCHFAQFDGEGRVRRGPAAIGLEHFPLLVLGGDLYVNPRIHVPDDTRTPV